MSLIFLLGDILNQNTEVSRVLSTTDTLLIHICIIRLTIRLQRCHFI